ncbi:MAG: hypothetical protein E6Q85_05540 [Thiothrix sp.]|nr:MAG: hypothetical protein E6Q85_05540 [Thiothrix sp.]
MKKTLSLAIFGASLLVASTGAFASQCGVGYSGYHRPAPTRAAVVHYQRQNHRVMNYRNQCVRVDGRITRAERNCLSNRHYQRPHRPNYHQVRRSQGGGATSYH